MKLRDTRCPSCRTEIFESPPRMVDDEYSVYSWGGFVEDGSDDFVVQPDYSLPDFVAARHNPTTDLDEIERQITVHVRVHRNIGQIQRLLNESLTSLTEFKKKAEGQATVMIIQLFVISFLLCFIFGIIFKFQQQGWALVSMTIFKISELFSLIWLVRRVIKIGGNFFSPNIDMSIHI